MADKKSEAAAAKVAIIDRVLAQIAATERQLAELEQRKGGKR